MLSKRVPSGLPYFRLCLNMFGSDLTSDICHEFLFYKIAVRFLITSHTKKHAMQNDITNHNLVNTFTILVPQDISQAVNLFIDPDTNSSIAYDLFMAYK